VKTALGALAMVASFAPLVAAQEVSVSDLAVKKTYLKTRSDSLESGPRRGRAFSV
jgi:hypothetical protein